MEKFTETGDHIITSNNGKTLTSTGNGYNCSASNAIGYVPISKNKIYKWTMCINKSSKDSMFIGITEKKMLTSDEQLDYLYDCIYGYKHTFGKEEDYGPKCKTGDIICMIVDMSRKEISIEVNGQNQGVMFGNIPSHTYYMVVRMYTSKYAKGDSMSITDFSVYNFEENKEKELISNIEIENIKLKKQISKLTKQQKEIINNKQIQKKEMEKLQRQLETVKEQENVIKQERVQNYSLLDDMQKQLDDKSKTLRESEKQLETVKDNENVLKKEINKLQRQLETVKEQENGIKRENSALKQEINRERDKSKTFEAQNIALRDNENILKKEINKLRQKNNNLLDDKKEMELKIFEIVKQNEILIKNSLNYNNWREWDSIKVFYFIMDTIKDGSLKQYENDIKNEMIKIIENNARKIQ
eukprot:339842_1